MTHAALTGERGAAEAWTSFSLRGGPDVAARARAESGSIRAMLGDEVAGDVALIVSELVSNSFRHSDAAEPAIHVDLQVFHGRVRGEIEDGGSGFKPAPAPPDRRGVGGWGLHIVDKLCDRWGVRSEAGGGCTVWFEVRRPGSAGAVRTRRFVQDLETAGQAGHL